MPAQDNKNYIGLEVFNGLSPAKKPRALPLALDFSVTNPVVTDLTIAQEADRLEFVQAIYVDNSLNPFPLVCTVAVTNQVLSWPAFSQGYLPALVPNSPKLSFATIGTPMIIVELLSFPMPAMIWTLSNTSSFRLLSANTTNATLIKAGPGQLTSFYVNNTANGSQAFLKFYDKATAPVVGTDIPKLVFALPSSITGLQVGTNSIYEPVQGVSFNTGIAIAITGAVADADTTAVALNQIVANIMFQ